MLYQAVKKVAGGKFIRVKLEADAQINAVRINGDFFLHPEDSLPEIEKTLAGLSADSAAATLAQKIHETLAREKAAFMGVTPEDIAVTIIEALKNKNAPGTTDAPHTAANTPDTPLG